MHNYRKILGVVIALVVTLTAACQPIQPMPEQTQSAAAATQDDATIAAKIAMAMRAAGPAISKDATIMDWPAEPGGEFVVLREGANRWTCFPPETYMPEGVAHPMCMDEVWLAFMKARYAHEELPPVTTPGIAYMLDGGGTASISDPFAREPAAGQAWIKNAPPHMMVLTPGDLSGYSHTPGPEPWVMYADTSFAHLMLAIPMPEK